MSLKISNTNILENTKGLIILPIDGIGAGHEGRIGRQYAESFPDHWRLINKKLEFPMALGKTSLFIKNSGIEGFDYVLVAATLNHVNELSRNDARGIVVNVMRQALNIATGFEIPRVATVVLKGGWRLSLDEAFMAMLDACDLFQGLRRIELEVFENNQAKHERLKSLAQTFGW